MNFYENLFDISIASAALTLISYYRLIYKISGAFYESY